MEFICKKTTELTDDELSQISVLFESVFQKQRDKTFFLNQYSNNILGYSYHSLIKDNDTIVGLNSYIPALFWYDGEQRLFVNSVDSMVAKPYRDFFNYQDMVETAYQYMSKENVEFVYGYPNENAYPVLMRSRLMKEIGSMRIYCLPYRIGGIKSKLKVLNIGSRLFSRCAVELCRLFASKEEYGFPIHKDIKSYNQTRYLRADADYRVIGNKTHGFVYKVMMFDGIRSAFLIDVYPKSSKIFNTAIRYILKKEKANFDILLYVGCLPFKNTGLLKLPIRMEPKKFHFMGKALNPTLDGDELFQIVNWDTNLSNYDLI